MIMRIDPHLEIRQRRPEDAEELFALTEANRIYLKQWLPWLDHCTSSDDTRRNILTSLEEASRGVSLEVCIWHQGRIVGVTGFNSISRVDRIGHIGYWLGEEYSGQGMMTRAVRALTGHGFETLGLNRITIAAAVGNGKSRAIAERLGFRLEGISREAEWLYDHFVDHALYAIIRSDWDASAEIGSVPARNGKTA
jgi:ribosomal-protein-serine acetyltransferase